MPTDLDLLTRIAFLQAGGKERGERDIDKINAIFGSVGQLGGTLSQLGNESLSRRLAALKQSQLEQEQTPISQIVGETPQQTQTALRSTFERPVQESPDERMRRLQSEIEQRKRRILRGQEEEEKYGSATVDQASKISGMRAQEALAKYRGIQTDKINTQAKIVGKTTKGASLDRAVPYPIVKDYFVNILGYDEENVPEAGLITYRDLQEYGKAHGREVSGYLRSIGLDIQANKNLFGEIEPTETKERIQQAIKEKPQKAVIPFFKKGEKSKQQTIVPQVSIPKSDIREKAKALLQTNNQPITDANIDHAINQGWVK